MPWINIEDVVLDDPPPLREQRQVLDLMRRGAKPRFYADENFPRQATRLLRRLGADILTVQEARLSGHPDENHTAQALRLGRILISCDRDYLDERRFPLIHCPAIVVCGFGSGTVEEITWTFDCLVNIFKVPQFFDKWIKIDASRDGWTEYARFQDGTTSRYRCRVYRGKIQEWSDGPAQGFACSEQPR